MGLIDKTNDILYAPGKWSRTDVADISRQGEESDWDRLSVRGSRRSEYKKIVSSLKHPTLNSRFCASPAKFVERVLLTNQPTVCGSPCEEALGGFHEHFLASIQS